jgi:hypothetical protein
MPGRVRAAFTAINPIDPIRRKCRKAALRLSLPPPRQVNMDPTTTLQTNWTGWLVAALLGVHALPLLLGQIPRLSTSQGRDARSQPHGDIFDRLRETVGEKAPNQIARPVSIIYHSSHVVSQECSPICLSKRQALARQGFADSTLRTLNIALHVCSFSSVFEERPKCHTALTLPLAKIGH